MSLLYYLERANIVISDLPSIIFPTPRLSLLIAVQLCAGGLEAEQREKNTILVLATPRRSMVALWIFASIKLNFKLVSLDSKIGFSLMTIKNSYLIIAVEEQES